MGPRGPGGPLGPWEPLCPPTPGRPGGPLAPSGPCGREGVIVRPGHGHGDGNAVFVINSQELHEFPQVHALL